MASSGDAPVLKKIMNVQERDRWVQKYGKIVQPGKRKKLMYVLIADSTSDWNTDRFQNNQNSPGADTQKETD
jgi:hypothetical protein